MARLRKRRAVPIVVITADVTQNNEPLPDDAEYLVRPFEPDELAAVVKEMLENPGGRRSRTWVRAGELRIDQVKDSASKGGETLPLTDAERSLLRHLAANPGTRASGRDLLIKIWGDDYAEDHDFLSLWISRLRQKIEADPADPKIIVGEGTGYTLIADAD